MFWGIIHRMILVDLFKIFCISLIALTGLILMAGVIAEATRNGLGPMQIVMMIPLLLPSMLPYTVPTTTLFATCIVYGRLSADNEILALKAAGIHIMHIIFPALFLGFLSSAVTLFLFIDTIPYTHFLLKTTMVGDVEELLYAMLKKDGCIDLPKLDFEIHTKELNGRRLILAEFRKRGPGGKGIELIALAKEAELRVDAKNKKLLIDMRHCEIIDIKGGSTGYVESRIWEVELPDFSGPLTKNKSCDMTWSELLETERRLEAEKQRIGEAIDLHQVAIAMGNGDAEKREHVRNLIYERKNLDGNIFAIQTEYHLRAAFAFGCICFALVGCPVGIWLSKSDYLSAFITCFLPIVTIYYPLMLCMINLARSGKVLPWMGVYAADGLMLLAGAILFRKLARN